MAERSRLHTDRGTPPRDACVACRDASEPLWGRHWCCGRRHRRLTAARRAASSGRAPAPGPAAELVPELEPAVAAVPGLEPARVADLEVTVLVEPPLLDDLEEEADDHDGLTVLTSALVPLNRQGSDGRNGSASGAFSTPLSLIHI